MTAWDPSTLVSCSLWNKVDPIIILSLLKKKDTNPIYRFINPGSLTLFQRGHWENLKGKIDRTESWASSEQKQEKTNNNRGFAITISEDLSWVKWDSHIVASCEFDKQNDCFGLW